MLVAFCDFCRPLLEVDVVIRRRKQYPSELTYAVRHKAYDMLYISLALYQPGSILSATKCNLDKHLQNDVIRHKPIGDRARIINNWIVFGAHIMLRLG